MEALIWAVVILAMLLIIAILKIVNQEKLLDRQDYCYDCLKKKCKKDTATLGEAVEEQQRKILQLEEENQELLKENARVWHMYNISEETRIRAVAERGGNG